MLKKLSVVALVSSMAVSLSAQALIDDDVRKSIELKDGSTVHIFANGKMGMENRVGRTLHMAEGMVMETKDGATIKMVGNEVARVDIRRAHRFGGR